MATLNDVQLVNGQTSDVSQINKLLGGIFRSEFSNTENLSATRVLLDADMPIQRFNCNGADRILKMPTANTTTNHIYFIVNSTSSGTYKLTVQDNAGAITYAALNPSEYIMMMPDGNGAYVPFGNQFWNVVSPTQITANQNNYNPTGASSASALRLSTDASRDITGFAFPAAYKTILVHNVGSYNIVLKDESASSTAANRFALNGDATISPDQSVLLWYDTTSSRWRLVGGGASSSGTGGLAVSIASVISSNVTGVEDTHHILDVSGMTLNCDFNLPTPTAAGKRCRVTLSTGDATYALIVKVNSVEVTRLFITNETLEFISTGTGAGNWQLSDDGRINSVGIIERRTAQSINSTTDTKIQFATSVKDVGNICDVTTNYRITVRRAGPYDITAYLALDAQLDDQEVVAVYLYINGALDRIQQTFISFATANRTGVTMLTIKKELAVGDYIEMNAYHTEGAAVNTNTLYYPQLAVIEI